ncbi:MAG TPA: ferric reductase-like transmembrane domain-containing protein [Solirubrobacteraceae bacterium]|jgi:sulfoxide reductase heme-binding subunit YedZ|nr:ferric reductase-like transmembrane domain-containing protein [Solirubrobacteraceae bacterium]
MTIFALSSQTYWYLTRSTGAVALLLLTAVVVLGTLSPMRVAGTERWPRFAVGALHRDLSLLALAVLVVHIVTSVLDTFAPIGWLDAIIPLHSAYRPLWLGLGALAFDLLLALIITSLVRRRLGYERWQKIHWLAYACWPIAVLHGLGTGSDTNAAWLEWITVGCGAAVLVAVVVRINRGRTQPQARAGWLALSLLTPLGIAIFALAGPLRSGWAAKAGTPTTDLHGGARRTTVAAVSTTAPHTFSAKLQGSLTRHSATGGALVDLALSLRGATPGTLRIRLAGKPIGGGGLSLIGSQVDLSAPRLGPVLAGTVVSLSGARFRARVRQSTGAGYDLTANLDINPASGAVSGRLDAVELR